MRAEGNAATINAHGGPSVRHAEKWGEWLHDFALAESLDIICAQEMTSFHVRAARRGLGDEWAIVCRNDWPGADDNAVFVRKAWERVAHDHIRHMGRRRWLGNIVKRLHDPRSLTSALCRNGLTAASSHAPPGVDSRPISRRQRQAAIIVRALTGKPDRVRAWVAFWKRFEQWGAKRNDRGQLWLVGLDLNERLAVPGEWTPKAVARRLNANAIAVGIDGFIASNDLELSDVKQHKPGPGMDHHAVTVRFTEKP